MRYLKPVALLLLTVLLFGASVLCASAEEYGVTVFDTEGFIADGEPGALAAISDPHGTELYFVSGFSGFTSAEIKRICGIERGDSAVVLAVDRSAGTYYYEMFTYGHADKLLSQRACDAILDDPSVYYAIKGGRILEGAEAFFSLTVLAIGESWRAPTPLWKSALITALVVGALAGGGSALGVFLWYRKKQRGVSYPLDRYARLSLTVADDRFIGRSVVRTRVQSASGGGGGRSSGGGSRGRR